MIFLTSLIFLIFLGVLCVLKSPHAIGQFLFIEFFFPTEIVYTSLMMIGVSKVAFCVFFIYVFNANKKQPIYKYPLIILPVLFFFCMFGAYVVSDLAKPIFRMVFYDMTLLFLPGVLIFYAIKTYEDFILTIKWCTVLIFLWTGYGIYEYAFKANFLIDRLILEFPRYSLNVFKGYDYTSYERFGSSVRIQGTVFHPIGFGGRINLLLSLLMLMLSLIKEKIVGKHQVSKVFRLAIILAIGCVLLSSLLSFTRSAWVYSLMILVLYFYVHSKHKKTILLIALPLSLALFISVGAYYLKWLDVEGSSINMRIEQFNAVIKMASDNIVIGLGPDFIENFIMRNGGHTVVFGFESFFFIIIVGFGLLGVTYYCLFFILLTKWLKDTRINPLAHFAVYGIIPYLIFILLTGELQTMWVFWLACNIGFALAKINQSNIKIASAILAHNKHIQTTN